MFGEKHFRIISLLNARRLKKSLVIIRHGVNNVNTSFWNLQSMAFDLDYQRTGPSLPSSEDKLSDTINY
jgi:hypothetical protein